MSIQQVCAIFKNNPKTGFTPKKIIEKLNNNVDGIKYRPGTVRQWIKRLKDEQIIEKKSKTEYQFKDEAKALQFLEKRYKTKEKPRSTPQAPPESIRRVEEHLLKLDGTVTYPAEVIDLWLSMGILNPPKPNDPAQQATWSCESFKIVLSLKSYRGSMYVYRFDYKEKAEELFGKDFRDQIKNLEMSKHSGFIAEDMVGYKYGTKELGVEVDSGSRGGMVEVELKGGETLSNNAFKNILRKGVDTTIIEHDIFEILDKLERRQTRELHAINTVLNRVVDSIDHQSKITTKGFENVTKTLEKGFEGMNKQLAALFETLKPKQTKLEPESEYPADDKTGYG